MIGSLQSLQERYQQAGSQLLILHANPLQAIPNLAAAVNAKAVFWNWDVEPYSKERDQAVLAALKEKGITGLINQYIQRLFQLSSERLPRGDRAASLQEPRQFRRPVR